MIESNDHGRLSAEHALDRHREHIEGILGPEYRSSERYARMIDEVIAGRTALNVVLDLNDYSAHQKRGW
jgi:hypothetical protein